MAAGGVGTGRKKERKRERDSTNETQTLRHFPLKWKTAIPRPNLEWRIFTIPRSLLTRLESGGEGEMVRSEPSALSLSPGSLRRCLLPACCFVEKEVKRSFFLPHLSLPNKASLHAILRRFHGGSVKGKARCLCFAKSLFFPLRKVWGLKPSFFKKIISELKIRLQFARFKLSSCQHILCFSG